MNDRTAIREHWAKAAEFCQQPPKKPSSNWQALFDSMDVGESVEVNSNPGGSVRNYELKSPRRFMVRRVFGAYRLSRIS